MSFDPVFSPESRAIILGTWPSPKSWEQGFYYGHPQNRFWPLMARLTEREVPKTIPQKKELILESGLALWDVLESCTIQGAADSSIRNPVPTDLAGLLQKTHIEKVYCNGAKAKQLYDRFLLPKTKIEAVRLPSTSPANAAFSPQRLYEEWNAALGPILKSMNEQKAGVSNE